MYTQKNSLLHTPGFRRCKRTVRKQEDTCNDGKPSEAQVPRGHDEVLLLDELAGNTMWADSEKLEIEQLMEYNSFVDTGLGAKVPQGYNIITCHMIYECKHTGRHKSRFMTGGNRIDTPVGSC